MAIGVDNRIGVLSQAGGVSAPATLVEYLTSIGKDSWYGGFRAPLLLFSDFNNLVPVTTDGAAWRNWLPSWTAGGFSASWGQSTGSRRCALGLSRNGKPGVYGDATDWWANLSSTTELNRDYTVLMSTWTTMGVITSIYSHNLNVHSWRSNGTSNDPLVYAGNVTGVTVEKVVESTPVTSTTVAHRIGWSTNGTSHHNNTPSIFRLTNNTLFSDSTIHELWFTERLSAHEISAALSYLI